MKGEKITDKMGIQEKCHLYAHLSGIYVIYLILKCILLGFNSARL